MRKLFGTDGIRGVANIDPMTTEMAMQLGRGVAYIFKNKDKRHRIVIGKDTRLSGYMLENALVAGICSMGVDVLLRFPKAHPQARSQPYFLGLGFSLHHIFDGPQHLGVGFPPQKSETMVGG